MGANAATYGAQVTAYRSPTTHTCRLHWHLSTEALINLLHNPVDNRRFGKKSRTLAFAHFLTNFG